MKHFAYILLFFLFFSCNSDHNKNRMFCICNEKNKEYFLSEIKEMNKLRLNIPIDSGKCEFHYIKLEKQWDKIIQYKKFILPILLCYKNDVSFSFYDTIPFTKNHLGRAAIPNYIHSLFLFEAIVRNDIFFNRNINHNFCKNHFSTRVEYINTIIDTKSPPSYIDSIKFPFTPTRMDNYFNHYYFNVDFSEYKQMYDKIWFLYAFWLIENYENAYYETFPLDGTKYRWGTFYEDGLKIKKKEPKSTNIH